MRRRLRIAAQIVIFVVSAILMSGIVGLILLNIVATISTHPIEFVAALVSLAVLALFYLAWDRSGGHP